jgi:putative phosphonate metabolism protein
LPEPDERWAVYYAPPAAHPLWDAGCRWLGRDPASDAIHDPPSWLAAEQWRALVSKPAHYGLHGTLRAPMRLTAGQRPADLRDLVASLAAAWTPFNLPQLTVQRLDDFIALCPTAPCPELDALARDCVRALDELRAPLNADERARRRPDRLTARQLELLETWGYPFVLEEFRFHLTLSGRLTPMSPEQADDLEHRLAMLFMPALSEPLPVDSLALYRQRGDKPFRLVERLPFGGPQGR